MNACVAALGWWHWELAGAPGLGEGFPTPCVPAARAAGLGSERLARLAAYLSRCLRGRVSSRANLPSSFNAVGKGRGLREVGMKQGGVTTCTVAETKNFWWIWSQRCLVADKSLWGWEGDEEGMRSEGLPSCCSSGISHGWRRAASPAAWSSRQPGCSGMGGVGDGRRRVLPWRGLRRISDEQILLLRDPGQQ